MSDRIAVIIPCYNHASFIGTALDSVLAQTRPADRILVIDDGSKDDSPTVLQRYVARGVEVQCRENRGAHNTLNELVELASRDCEWVAILNSDDRYLPERLAKCLEMAHHQPGKSVFATSLQVIDGEGKRMPEDAPRARWFHGAWSLGEQEGLSIAGWLGQANFIATTSNVFARAAYLKTYPFRPYRFNHDYFFLATAALENQIAISREVHLEYRVHGNNTIATRPEPLIREMLRLHLDLYKHHAAALRSQPDLRQRFYDFTRHAWESISSFHAGALQVLLAQMAAVQNDDDLEELASSLEGPEMAEFPNRLLAGSFDGKSSLSSGAVLSKRLAEVKASYEETKKDRDCLEKLSRFRQKMLRSKWVRLGLVLGLAHPLVSNRGKKPHEKLLWLCDACQGNWWLKLGEKLGSRSAEQLRRGEV